MIVTIRIMIITTVTYTNIITATILKMITIRMQDKNG